MATVTPAGSAADDLAIAVGDLALPSLTLETGPWVPPARAEWPAQTLGVLVTSGLITREVLVGDRTCAELIGAGEVLVPWRSSESLVPSTVRWTVTLDATVLVLEERFVEAAQRSPHLYVLLTGRMAEHGDREAMHAAICQLGRVEQRVLAFLWHLTERWGEEIDGGAVLPMRLTHETLGRLVGAQRPTVTLALRDLAATGTVRRRADGAWLLAPGSQRELTPA